MAHPHAHVRAHEQAHAEHHVRRAGYKAGGAIHADAEQDRKMITKGVHQHEDHEHGGKHTDLHLRGGGMVKGAHGHIRADRYARGGRSKSGAGKVNIVIATGGGEGERQMAFNQGAQVGSKLGAARPAMMPPPGAAPPPPGAIPPRPGMPPGGMPAGLPGPLAGGAPVAPPGGGAMMPPPRGPMQRGGRLPMTGAGGGNARLEKAGMPSMIKVRSHMRRRAGGRVECD